jgi:hypothetical protein
LLDINFSCLSDVICYIGMASALLSNLLSGHFEAVLISTILRIAVKIQANLTAIEISK